MDQYKTGYSLTKFTKFKLMVKKLTCACVMYPTMTPGLLFLLRKRVTLESSVAGLIVFGFKYNGNHKK